jgi:hypothetical protein
MALTVCNAWVCEEHYELPEYEKELNEENPVEE